MDPFNQMLMFLGPLIGGLILYAIINAGVKAPGAMLRDKFVRTNPLAGKTKSEIISAVGNPSSVSSIGEGSLLQWQATGYHIALQFDENDICTGVTHEFSA